MIDARQLRVLDRRRRGRSHRERQHRVAGRPTTPSTRIPQDQRHAANVDFTYRMAPALVGQRFLGLPHRLAGDARDPGGGRRRGRGDRYVGSRPKSSTAERLPNYYRLRRARDAALADAARRIPLLRRDREPHQPRTTSSGTTTSEPWTRPATSSWRRTKKPGSRSCRRSASRGAAASEPSRPAADFIPHNEIHLLTFSRKMLCGCMPKSPPGIVAEFEAPVGQRSRTAPATTRRTSTSPAGTPSAPPGWN